MNNTPLIWGFANMLGEKKEWEGIPSPLPYRPFQFIDPKNIICV